MLVYAILYYKPSLTLHQSFLFLVSCLSFSLSLGLLAFSLTLSLFRFYSAHVDNSQCCNSSLDLPDQCFSAFSLPRCALARIEKRKNPEKRPITHPLAVARLVRRVAKRTRCNRGQNNRAEDEEEEERTGMYKYTCI